LKFGYLCPRKKQTAMDFIYQIIDFVLHIDKHLFEIVSNYQTWTYLIIFLIIFAETGFVVTPFLPGDSLLFAAGAIAAMEGNPLSVFVLIPVIMVAAFCGDNTNYFIGRMLETKVYEKNYKLIKREYLDKTQRFYEKHGGKTVIIARFVPIVRTFAPFVAGVGQMRYIKFISYSVVGSILWANIFCWAGFIFGNIPIIKTNFTLVVFAIIILSVLPAVYAVLKQKFAKKEA